MCHYGEITEVEEQSKMLWETINSLDRQLKTFLVFYLLQYAWSLKCICGGALYKTYLIIILPKSGCAYFHEHTSHRLIIAHKKQKHANLYSRLSLSVTVYLYYQTHLCFQCAIIGLHITIV